MFKEIFPMVIIEFQEKHSFEQRETFRKTNSHYQVKHTNFPQKAQCSLANKSF